MAFVPGLRRQDQWVFNKVMEGQDTNKKDLDIVNKADIAQNCRFNIEVGSVEKRGLLTKYNTAEESNLIDSLYRYYNQVSGLSYVFLIEGGILRVATAGTFSTLTTLGSSSGKRFTAVTYNDLAIISTGYDNIIQSDGICAWELGACKAKLHASTASQMDASKDYYYAVVFNTEANGSGTDTVNGAVSTVVTQGVSAKAIVLDFIPFGDTDAASRKIYRTEGDGSTLKWVHIIGDNSTQTWTDTAADGGTISAAADGGGGEVDFTTSAAHGLQVGDRVTLSGFDPAVTYNASFTVVGVADTTHFSVTLAWDQDDTGTWALGEEMGAVTDDMPFGKYLYVEQERLFVACDTVSAPVSRASYIYYSEQYKPHLILTQTVDLSSALPAGNYEVFEPDDGDVITGIVGQLGTTFVFKQNSIMPWYIKGVPGVWEVGSKLSTVGCPAPYSIVQSPYGVLYQGWHHYYLFDGQYSTAIIDEVNVDETILDVRRFESFGFYWNNLYLVAYTSAEGAKSYHDRVLVFDLLRKQVSVDKGGPLTTGMANVNCWTAFKGSTEWGQLYGGDGVLGWVYQYDTGILTNTLSTGSAIDAGTYATGWADILQTSQKNPENNPIITRYTLDSMEGYPTTVKARSAWVTSETTAKVPPDLGTGTDGAKTVEEDETLTEGTYNYASLTVDADMTLTIEGNVTIKCLGDATINGTINITGSLNLYAMNITVGAAGVITGLMHLRSYLLDNSGTLSTDMIQIVGEAGSTDITRIGAGVGTINGTHANTYDGDNETYYGGGSSDQGGSGSIDVTTQFNWDAINLSSLTYSIHVSNGLGGSGTVAKEYQVYVEQDGEWVEVASDSNTSTGYFGVDEDGGAGTTDTTGWADVTGMKIHSYSYANGGSGAGANDYNAVVYHFEFKAMAIPTVDYFTSSGTVPESNDISDFVNALDVASEDSIVKEGTYSLRINCAPGAATLNDYVKKTVTAVDLSHTGYDTILMNVRARRAGTYFQFGMGEAETPDADWTWVNVPITLANTWTTIQLDFSGMADAKKNGIGYFAFKFTDTDAYNIVYVDNITTKATNATYLSPRLDIGAGSLGRIYWHENLASVGGTTYGDVKVYTRGSDTSTDFTTFTDDTGWSAAFTNPAGSDISGETAYRYFQYKIVFSSTNGLYFPYVYKADGYVVKLEYYKRETVAETSLEFRYRTGWRNFDLPMDDKIYRKLVSIHKGEEYTEYDLIIEADKQDTQEYTFSGINLGTNPYRFITNLPSNMYGKELRLEWYNNDAYKLTIQQFGTMVEVMPLI